MTSQIYYEYCRKSDLITFAANRGINVTSITKKSTNRLCHRDYASALRQADGEARFRFLDLPPELRNWIYEELLVLKNSATCHPEILRTSKLINKEASNILYGVNLIAVRADWDGVYAHGARCGHYFPAQRFTPIPFTALTWPSFLQRAQLILFSVDSSTLGQVRRRSTGRGPALSIGNILYSLTSFLASSKRLRSFEVTIDLRGTAGLEHPGRLEDLTTACYPLLSLRQHVRRPITFKTSGESQTIDIGTFGPLPRYQLVSAMVELQKINRGCDLLRDPDAPVTIWTLIAKLPHAVSQPGQVYRFLIEHYMTNFRVNLERAKLDKFTAKEWAAISKLLRMAVVRPVED